MTEQEKTALAVERLDKIEQDLIEMGDSFVVGPLGFAVGMLLKSARKDPLRFIAQVKDLTVLLENFTEGF